MFKPIVSFTLIAAGMASAIAEENPVAPAAVASVEPAPAAPQSTVAPEPVAPAADANVAKPLVGFEFGVNYLLYNDSRFEGNATTFALAYQVDQRIRAAVYHEQGHLHGEENGADANTDITINEFRIGLDLWSSETGNQNLGLLFGFGHASYSGDIDTSELIADVVVQYSPVRSSNGPVTGSLLVTAAYRYAPIDNIAVGGFTDTVDDLGGFFLGLGAGLYF